MAADEQGLDLDLDYTVTDNPFWDGTPASHPAWDRGMQHTAKMITKQLQKAVLGPESTEELTFQQVMVHVKAAMQTCNEIIIDAVLEELAQYKGEDGLTK